MQSGFAHFQRFWISEPDMNAPASPNELILAAIWRLKVLIDFGILIVWLLECKNM